jgi:hypothetical protein
MTKSDVEFALKVALITFAGLVLARSLAQQIGYGFSRGVILAATQAEKEGRN